jgi:putative Ca2+/H+ antiporter (TMEM165/GDT1 family)
MLTSLLSTFVLVLIAELGDKTQLCTLALALKYKKTYSIIFGAGLGFLIVDSIAVIVGSLLLDVIPLYWLKIGAGIMFIFFGIYFYFKKEQDYCPTGNNRSPFLSSFILICTTEMGDKTQIMVAVLSASYAEPLAVISGAMIALVGLTALTVLVGNKLTEKIPMKTINKAVPIIFIVLGILQIIFHD